MPIPGKDSPLWRFDPLVEITTSRGVMVFELFPAEAPVHVHSFLQLIERHAYDGLTFHRVVPDFVVQGGDYRGDGNGARPWEGESLRAEFTPRKTTRGSLGMPRNEDPDSGGSQFFVTHLPTPTSTGATRSSASCARAARSSTSSRWEIASVRPPVALTGVGNPSFPRVGGKDVHNSLA